MLKPENKRSLKDAKSNIIAIFIKLFATSMVANNFLGLDTSFWTISNFFEFPFSEESTSKSEAVNENKATSAPEIKAEQISKRNKIITLII